MIAKVYYEDGAAGRAARRPEGRGGGRQGGPAGEAGATAARDVRRPVTGLGRRAKAAAPSEGAAAFACRAAVPTAAAA